MTRKSEVHFPHFYSHRNEPFAWDVWTCEDEVGVFTQGDPFEITVTRTLFWSLLDNTNVAAIPRPEKSNLQASLGAWVGVLELLAYGNGWVNIRRELNGWALSGFEVIAESVLGRIQHDLGPAIWALVWYLNAFPEASDNIQGYLEDIESPEGESMIGGIYEGRGPNFINPSVIMSHIEAIRLEERYPFTRVLLGDFPFEGEDPADLSGAFTHFSQVETSGDIRLEELAMDRLQVSCRFPHWYRHTHTSVKEFVNLAYLSSDSPEESANRRIWLETLRVDVWVYGIGFMGQFKFNEERNRLVREDSVFGGDVPHRFFPDRFGENDKGLRIQESECNEQPF